MTEPKTPLSEELEHLRRDAEAMERPQREIPLPKDEDDDDGVGPVTGVVP
ncbi:hypothetical protein [Brevundimonas sp. M20]|jgi:hypothetical protein|nr:hypothetical protein [Brevundimonas sp. M20]